MVGLAERGHHVEVFVYHPRYQFFRERITKAGIRIRECDRTRIGSWRTLVALRKAMEAHNPDAMIAFLAAPSMLAEVARIGRQLPVLLVSERSSHHGDRWSLGAWTRRALHSLADRVVTNSVYHSDWIQRSYPWLQGRVHCIYNGVASEYFSLAPAARPDGEVRILAIGRIAASKNPVVLARACALHAARHGWSPQVTWVGRQGERPEDLSHRNEVDALLAREPRVAAAWRWAGESNRVAGLMAEHHLLVHPSLYEGLPNVVCEALAAGRPVLLSSVCEHPRLAGQPGERGHLFEPDDPEGLLRGLEALTSQSERDWTAMTERCREFARKELAVERMVAGYEALVDGALSE